MTFCLDGSNLIYISQHRIKHDEGFSWNSLVRSFITSFFTLVENRRFCKIIVLFDQKGSVSEFRKKIFADYKSKRHTQETEAESKAHKMAIAFLATHLPSLGFSVVIKPGLEADDTAFSITHKFSCGSGVLVSSDGDWKLNLVPKWSLYQLRQDKIVTYEDMCKDFGEKPIINFLFFKALKGDSGDCVPGVRFIGEKKALALIRGIAEGRTVLDFPFAQRILDEFDIVSRNMVLLSPFWILEHRKTMEYIEMAINNVTIPKNPSEAFFELCDELDDDILRNYWSVYVELIERMYKGRGICNG